MKKINIILLMLLGLSACYEEESYIYEGPSTITFSDEREEIFLERNFESDSTISGTIQLIGVQQPDELSVTFQLTEESTAKSGVHLTFPTIITIPANSSEVSFQISIHGSAFDQSEIRTAILKITSQGVVSNNNLHEFTIKMEKQSPPPSCALDLSPYLEQYNVINEEPGFDPWGYSTTFITDPSTPNRLIHKDFWGWVGNNTENPIYFDLACETGNNTILVPKQAWVNPNGWGADIEGNGTYDINTGQLTIDFTWTQTDGNSGSFKETYTVQ